MFSSCSRVKNHFDEDPRHAAITLQRSLGLQERGYDVSVAQETQLFSLLCPIFKLMKTALLQRLYCHIHDRNKYNALQVYSITQYNETFIFPASLPTNQLYKCKKKKDQRNGQKKVQVINRNSGMSLKKCLSLKALVVPCIAQV